MNIRYDKIKIRDGSDKFDPFSVHGSPNATNSYIDEKSYKFIRGALDVDEDEY
jgi:hypothetical protein